MKKTNMTNISQNWLEILIAFTNDYNQKLTSSQIAKEIKIPQRTVSRYLNKLNNLIRYEIEGKNKKYYLDLNQQKTKQLIFLIENYKTFKFLNTELFIMIEDIIKTNDVVLFGSYANNTKIKNSDIDLLIIGKKSQEIKKLSEKQPKKINIHFSTIKEFKELLKNKNTLAIEILKNHVVFGSSEFINLCWEFYGNKKY